MMRVSFLPLLLFLGEAAAAGNRVYSITPTSISAGGGVIFIYGTGFAGDNFNFQDPILGNKIWFYNDYETLPCASPIKKNWLLQNPQDPSTTKIVCSLPARQSQEGSSRYTMKLTVDGNEVENAVDFSVNFDNWRTPILRKINHRYGAPGDQVTVFGRIISKNVGPGASDVDNFDEMDTKSLQNIFFASANCELMDELGAPLGVFLDKDSNDNYRRDGNITCKTSGSFIGPQNATLLVSGYGQSIIDKSAYSVNSKGQAFFYHTLPEVSAISPNTGADIGGTFLTLEGLGFDGYKDNTQVFINDALCENVEVTSTTLVCKTPAEADVGSSTGGPRGMKYNLWQGEVVDETAIGAAVDALDAATSEEFIVDQGFIEEQMSDEQSDYTGRLSGVFIAPNSGNFSFAVCANDAAELYLSTTTDPAGKAMVASRSSACSKGVPSSSSYGDRVELVAGEGYWIEAVHVHRDSVVSNKTNFLQISLLQFSTFLTANTLSLASNENQGLYLKEQRVLEKQKITIEGLSDAELTFMHNGIPSQTPVYSSDTSDWADGLGTMFEWQCTKSQTNFKLANDCEDETFKLDGQGGQYFMNGAVEAFCGKGALSKPWNILSRTGAWNSPALNIKGDSKFLCFAYKGTAFYNGIDLLIRFDTKHWSQWDAWVNVNVTLDNAKNDWIYKCIDMEEAVMRDAPNWVLGNMGGGNGILVKRVAFPHTQSPRQEGWLDEITFGNKEITIERVAPAFANTATKLEDVNVTATADGVEIEFNPYTCQAADETMSLLGVMGATIEEMTTNATGMELMLEQTEFLKTNDMATFLIGGGKVIVERLSKESPKMEGSFSLAWNGMTVDSIPPYVEFFKLQEIFENEFGLMGVEMVNHRWDHCYNWHVSWSFNYIGGDQPAATIDHSNIINHGEADSVHSGVWTGRDGGVTILQPGGDFFRQPATSGSDPEITVWVSGFLSLCSGGADCSFNYDASLTPTITGVADSLVDGAVELTVSGTGFTTDPTDFIIDVGGRACTATDATATSVTCTLENGPAGDFDITLWVKSRGKADGSVVFTLSLNVESFSPNSGSVGGGTTLTILGTGFPNTMDEWTGNEVTVGGNLCTITSTSYMEIKCITAAEGLARRRKRALADLSLTVNGQTVSGGSYNYDPASTATITSLSPLTSTPAGGDTLTITGTTFDYESVFNTVTIAGEDCAIITWMPTEVTCVLPPLPNGEHTVVLGTKDNGYADASAVSGITVTFTLTGASPRVGSFQGGTKMTITGSGFGDGSMVEFNIGPEHTCVPAADGCTDTKVTCTVTKTATMYTIRNTGRHFKFGPGYMWQPASMTVRPGDKVRWAWNLPVAQEGTGISVHSVASSQETEYNGKGFKYPGEKSAKGNYVWQFMSEGSYNYNTEDVITDEEVFMAGKVIVALPDSDEVVSISATNGPISAEVIAGGSPTAPAPPAGCTFADSSCTSEGADLEFTFASCLTSEITSIAVSSGEAPGNTSTVMGFAGAELTISGSGFSDVTCENIVMIGDSNCTVTSAAADSLVCDVDASTITSLVGHTVNVNVINNGFAVQKVGEDSAGKLYVVPKIDSISPLSGSWAGGSILTLSGSGLNPSDGIVTINFGEGAFAMACAIVEVTASKVACVVPDMRSQKAGDEKTVELDMYFGGQMLRAEVDVAITPEYVFTSDLTPTTGDATPSEFSSSSSIEVAGAGFGTDVAAVSVFLRPTVSSSTRRRRSISSRLEEISSSDTFGYGPKPKLVLEFWKSIKKERPSRSIEWMSAGSDRSKRSLPSYLPTLSPEDHVDELEELFHPEIEHMHVRTVKRDVDYNVLGQEMFEEIYESDPHYVHRRKRSASRAVLSRARRSTAEELLEMSMEGTTEAVVSAVSDTSVTFTAPELPAGTYEVVVYVSGSGHADAAGTTLTSQAMADSITPDAGSTFGGQTVVIAGNGFSESTDDTTVAVGSAACEVTACTSSSITCTTPAGADGSADFVVTSNGVEFPAVAFSYSADSTPTVTGVTPSEGTGAQSLTIAGSNFGASPTVEVGDFTCSVTGSTSSPDTVSCDLPAIPGGEYAVVVFTAEFGLSDAATKYTSVLTASAMTPISGSFGGGSLLTITGQGFDTTSDMSITVCEDECIVQSGVTDNELTCITPANSGSGTESCDVTVILISKTSVLAGSFTYDDALTPQVTGVSPQRGGTGGGTEVTVTGTGFAATGNKVMIDESICDITAESATSITCLTNRHAGCIEVPVTVEVPSQGYGKNPTDGSTDFYYIDRWNSIFTWGGTGTPLAGELIHITAGQTIMLDTSTPILKMLLIDGGKLIYDRDANGLNLHSEFILIINGGVLEIGTEDDRYLNEAQITMHGHTRCTELPIYGCKSIGVRDGTLDLHGEFIPMTWTRLASTAEIGDTAITLEHGVNWKPGSEIIVATTGGRASMGESEKMVIDSVSADGTVVTLTQPLKAKHLSIMQTFGTHDIETRGEVGLLSRNIKIKGNVNQQFVTEIPACEKPFVANEEAEQSCFQGKFGEEIGTDEMGAIIFIHAKEINKHLATARISYTEFNEVGQAFRVGRYPIHFHINGNVTGSYVRGNAIHHSYNRAVTIHAVNNLLVEHNVAFDVKGLTFFIEDGIEEDNIIQYNLAVYTRQSSSLLNPDIQPGSFWIVNPNNILQHNAVAGSTHFGFWFRVLKNPDGPSRTTSYCPARAPMGRFYNNSAHSNGLYGIWMFTAGEHGWHPHSGTRENGYCDGNPITATLGDFIAWNNEIGVEIVEGGAIRFENMTLLDNEKSGIENIHTTGAERQNGEAWGASTFKNGIVVAHSKLTEDWENGDSFCTKHGVMHGWWGGDIENVEFYNFDRPKCAAMANCARCKPKWSAGKTQTSGLSFIDSPNKISWRWTMGGFYEDLDGTLCGSADCKVVQKRDIYDPDHCTDDTDDEFSHIAGGPDGKDWLFVGLLENDTLKLEGSVCDDTMKFHVVGFNNYAPTSLQFNDVVFHNEFGHAKVPWRKKPPYKDGWAGVLPEGTTNFFFWDTMGHITNITYEMGAFIFPEEGDHLLLGHNFTQSPDVFTFNGEAANSSNSLDEPPTYDTAGNTDWYWSGNETKEITYMLSYKDKTTRRKRGGMEPREKSRHIQFRVYRCAYLDCLPPPPPTVPPGRPTEFMNWSSEDDWASLGLTKPVAEADGIIEEWVTIPPGVWMVMDESPPPMIRLMIYGTLEIADEMDMTLSAEIIMIQGDLAQMVAGFADAPYTHNFDLVLRGNHETPDQPLPDGPNLGAKALGVFGQLSLHGMDVGRTWTRLAQDAAAGDNTLVLAESVDPTYWKEGAEIIIAPTGFEPLEKEKMTILSCDGTTITLNDTLKFGHLGSEYSLEDGSRSWNISAEIGLLTRNIKIIGESYSEISVEEFGARVLVSKFKQEGVEYRGYARISNVEFVRGAQEGWTDAFDPRYTLAFVNHEASIDNDPYYKESYVKKCAFNYNYNAAIGLFNTDNVLVEDNVVFRTLEYGVRDEGIGNRWIHNLVMGTRFVGAHKRQRQNFYKRACFYFKESLDPEFRDNAAVACDRAGFSGTGHICSSNKRWSNNVIHTTQDGVFVNTFSPPVEIRDDKECVVFRGFFIYRAYDYAFYLLTHDRVEMEDNIMVDNGVGIHPFLIRPRPTSHVLEYKHLRINNTLFVGRNDPTQCDTDMEPSYLWFDKERNKGSTMWPGRNYKGYKTGHAGLLWPIFSGIGVPLGKPWINGKPKSFPLLTGQVYLNNNTFANFNPDSCDGQFDSVVRTNPRGDDMQFPIINSMSSFVNVADSSRVWMDRPLDKLVVGEHCVDMHCDGLKKALLIDTDGSMIGDDIEGTIVADSAYEWEGNPTAGLGYFRVPKTMITTAAGDKIEYVDKLPNTGIVRNDQCTWVEKWHAYKCHGIDHRLLILESMDIDTLDRRLSPIAMLANPGSNGYIDLINGPQDWSCCFGYACQKRISNFYTIVGTNMMYEVHLTSVNPIHMRFRLKNNDGGNPVLLKIFFQKPQRIDIFVADRFVSPNNIDLSSDAFAMLPANDSYIPSLSSQINGENFFDPTTGFLYLLLDGSEPVDYKVQPSVVTKIGATIDMDNFFEGDVAGNIAALLGIDPANIRVTNIVRENRRKRFAPTWAGDAENIIMELTIEPPPKTSLNSTTTMGGGPPMEIGDLKTAMAELTNSFQNGSIGASLGMNVSTMAIQEPIYVPTAEDLPPQCIWQDEDPLADCYLDPENNAQDGVLWADASQANATAKLEQSLQETELKQPKKLRVMTEPAEAWEMSPFGVQPVIYAVDQDGMYIGVVGAEADPWIVTASVSNGTGTLINNVTCGFVEGLCAFENLAIDTMGTDYVLSFSVTYGSDSVEDATSAAFDVGGRPLSVKFTDLATLNAESTPFSAVVSVWDNALDEPLAAASAMPVAATCTISLSANDTAAGAVLEGTTEVDVVEGKANFDDLEVTGTVTGGSLVVTCSDSDSFNHVGTSEDFNVHPYPRTGDLKDTKQEFSFKGDGSNIQKVMQAMVDFVKEESSSAP